MYDLTLENFPRLEGEASDDFRIMRAVSACESGVLYIPKGIYEIANMLEITNCCSLLLHKSAVLKAVKDMLYVLKYDAALSYPDLQEKDGYLMPSDDHDAEDWNLFIKGGVFDGAGMAGCVCLNSFKHFTMRDSSFRNGKNFGLKIEDAGSTWTYELVATNLYFKCTMPGLGGNAGISSNGGDSHFIDCIVVDYTKGFELLGGGSNRLTRCHVWGGPIKPRNEGELPEMLIDSVNFLIDSGDTILTDCYADTGKTGYLIKNSTRMFGCSYFNNFTYKMDDVTVIDHVAGKLLVSGGMFRKTSPVATLYKGDKKELIWQDNILDGDWEPDVI
ncbi:MAG: hypothetical protein K6G11_03520 [Lachnospiraceae bacterium]|nr:hypothetical protein [Lachnospiraceae bacterium]